MTYLCVIGHMQENKVILIVAYTTFPTISFYRVIHAGNKVILVYVKSISLSDNRQSAITPYMFIC